MNSIQLVKSICVKYSLGRCSSPIMLLTLYKLSLFHNCSFELLIYLLDSLLIENISSIQNRVKNYTFLSELKLLGVKKTFHSLDTCEYPIKYHDCYEIHYLGNLTKIRFVCCCNCGKFMMRRRIFFTLSSSFLKNSECKCLDYLYD